MIKRRVSLRMPADREFRDAVRPGSRLVGSNNLWLHLAAQAAALLRANPRLVLFAAAAALLALWNLIGPLIF